MGEPIGTLASAAQLLEVALEIVQALKKAYDRQKDHPAVLERCRQELEIIKNHINNVKHNKALRTPLVETAVQNLQRPEQRLVSWLSKVDRHSKKAVSQFLSQLVKGSAERKKLDEILEELSQAKLSLIFGITATNAEATRKIGKKVGVGSKEPPKSRQMSHHNSSKPIKENLVSKSPARRMDSPNHFNDRSNIDTSSSGSDDGSSSGSSDSATVVSLGAVEKIQKFTINGCKTYQFGIMLNAPLEVGSFDSIPQVAIKDNEARDHSVMVNFPNDLEKVQSLAAFQDQRFERIMKLQHSLSRS